MKKKLVVFCLRKNSTESNSFQDQIFELFCYLDVELIIEPFKERSSLNYSIFISVFRQYLRNFNTKYPFRNSFFHNYHIQADLHWRIMNLRGLLKSFDFDKYDVFLIGISTGSVIASQLASEFPVKSTLAFAYPLLHPEYGIEKYSIKHLIQSNQSVYLFQAVYDEYSSPYLIMRMLLTHYFEIYYFETDGKFQLNEFQLFRIKQIIQNIIS